jgi:carbonic anhydrase
MGSSLAGVEALPSQPPRSGVLFPHVGQDFAASLVVFLVAVPLSMGIALASNAPIMSGLLGAAIGGIVTGLLAGAPLQVSGPAAGLTVVVFGLTNRYGFEKVCVMTLLAGAMQVVMGFLRIARLTMAISPAVIHGMLAGVGVLIALSQSHVVLGGVPLSSALSNLRMLPERVMAMNPGAAIVGLLTMAALLLWPLVPMKRLRILPGALIAVLLGTLISLTFDVPRVLLPGGLLAAIRLPQIPPLTEWSAILTGALTISLIASAESLLCAVATDKLHTGSRANLDKELIAQGVGNMVSGLIGGLPLTGVIVRSKANLDAGGKTRLAAILHGVWVVLLVSLLGAALGKVPQAALGGLLVIVGIKLVNFGHIRELHKHHEARIYFVTFLGVVFVNLLAGIAIGIVAALAVLVHRLTSVTVTVHEREDGHLVEIRGALTFLGVPKLTAKLAAIRPKSKVVFDIDVEHMDFAGIEALKSFSELHEKAGGKVIMELLRSFSSASSPAVQTDSQTGSQPTTEGQQHA